MLDIDTGFKYEAPAIFTERVLTDIMDFADDWLGYIKNNYLQQLWDAINNAHDGLPELDIDYNKQNLSLDFADLENKRPEPPTDEQLTPGTVTYPSLRYALDNIVMSDIPDLPTAPTVLEVQALIWGESTFTSELITDINSNLLSWLQDGGTMLSTEAEDALWERNLDRMRDQHERNLGVLNDYFANGNWTQAPDARTGMLLQAMATHDRELVQRGHEITIEQARLAHDTSKFAITSSIQLDDVLRKYHDLVQNRSLDLAKSKIQIIIDSYNSIVDQYKSRVEAVKVSAQAAEAEVNAHAAKNRDIVNLYGADIEGYKAQLQGEFDLVETIAKVYGYKVSGYEADARATATLLDSKIKKFMADVDQEKFISGLDLDQAKLLFDAFFKLSDVDIEGNKTLAGICAQIASSALQRMSVSASLGASFGSSLSDSTSRTDPLNQERTTHSYTY